MKKLALEVKLPVFIFKEGDYFVAHTPALDLSTAGKTFNETKERFSEVVDIFFEEIIKKGTLNEVLQDLGWERIDRNWIPPTLIAQEIERIRIPVAAQ